ncbi:hypothetical protein Ancab_036770 [Ancistrocladus abbreviatus]
MAAAEARTAWQRAANRCFVQEDAKRAPKLACCQSSSSSSKQVDSGPTNAADGPDHSCIGFMPFNRNDSYSNLPPDAKWWLQLQPNYGHQKGLTYEQLTALEADMETSDLHILSMESQVGEKSTDSIGYEYIEPSLGEQSNVSTEKQFKVVGGELNAANDKIDQDVLELKSMTDYYDLMEMELAGSSVSKQLGELSFDVDSPLIGTRKVPWWRTTDREELASLVAQKSLDHIENCDLPPPQKMRVRRERYKDDPQVSASSEEWEAHSQATSRLSSGDSPNPAATKRRHWAAVKDERAENVPSNPLSTNYKDLTDTERIYDGDPGKAQLLEALCHSQTRAREAEEAAKQAYAEKEHIVKLFFRQASHLFAYKQWFRLLQLESLCLQINDKDPATSPLIPVLLPWMPYKHRKLRKNWQKSTKVKQRKGSPTRYDIGKYAVAFAVGLSLVGAGLLLGWTVGWLFPTL